MTLAIAAPYRSVCFSLLLSLAFFSLAANPIGAIAEPTVASATQSEQALQRLLITIRPTGFDPAEITVSGGPFLLAIDNKSGLDELTLLLRREGGSPVVEKRLSLGELKWREKIDLPQGDYLLTEATHPDWLCRITVTP